MHCRMEVVLSSMRPSFTSWSFTPTVIIVYMSFCWKLLVGGVYMLSVLVLVVFLLSVMVQARYV